MICHFDFLCCHPATVTLARRIVSSLRPRKTESDWDWGWDWDWVKDFFGFLIGSVLVTLLSQFFSGFFLALLSIHRLASGAWLIKGLAAGLIMANIFHSAYVWKWVQEAQNGDRRTLIFYLFFIYFFRLRSAGRTKRNRAGELGTGCVCIYKLRYGYVFFWPSGELAFSRILRTSWGARHWEKIEVLRGFLWLFGLLLEGFCHKERETKAFLVFKLMEFMRN